jgi:hypothetical protein
VKEERKEDEKILSATHRMVQTCKPNTKEAEARCGEFQASLVYIKRYYLQKKTNNIQPQ